jgi:hypothetical protein
MPGYGNMLNGSLLTNTGTTEINLDEQPRISVKRIII